MMHSGIFDIEALERRDYSTEGKVVFLNRPEVTGDSSETGSDGPQGELEVFDFVPEEPPRPWSLDDVQDSRVVTAIGEWGENALDGLGGSDGTSDGADERGKALVISLAAGGLLPLAVIAAPQIIK